MNLKSFGCSFIFGSELADATCVVPNTSIPSKNTYTAKLADHFGYKYQCYARPGSGNLQIAERVLSYANSEPALFVIGWTWIDRFDYWGDKPTWFDSTNWQTLVPVDTNNLAKTYYRDLHSQYRDKLTTLMAIKLVIDTLKQNDQKFIMTYIDDLIFETEWHTTPAVTDLQNYIKPYMTTFDGKTFLEWSRINNYAISSAFHPLEAAHQAAAEYIIAQRRTHSA
jgi:hypothetical protein